MTASIHHRSLRLATACTIAGLLAMTTGQMTSSRLEAQEAYGIAAKRPVIGGACAFCPWGSLAIVVRQAMEPLGYDVQICYTCSGGDASRIVSEARIPGERRPVQIAAGSPPPPDAPVDFGVTNQRQLRSAYLGLDDYGPPEGPYDNLRLFALIDQPAYLTIAVRRFSGIADLRQIAAGRLPVRIYANGEPIEQILTYYGITREGLESWGGSIESSADNLTGAPGLNPGGRPNPGRDYRNFDVYMHWSAVLANNPESMWYELTQRSELTFLQLPDDLLDQLASAFDLERVEIPQAYFAGVDRRIPTVGRNGQAIYGRSDAPDDFAYAVAKAMDEGKGLLKWAVMPFSYNPYTVWQVTDVPLHPGAARYYREVGYMR